MEMEKIQSLNWKSGRNDSVADPPTVAGEVGVRSQAATDQTSWKDGTSSSLPILGIETLGQASGAAL